MRRFARRSFLYLAIAFLAVCSATFAQELNLDNLAKTLGKEVRKARVKSVVVADFITKEGGASPQGRLLTDMLSERLNHHKKHFVVYERNRISDALLRAKLLPKDLEVTETLKQVGSALGVEAIITGILESGPGNYTLTVTLRNAIDGRALASRQESFAKSSIFDVLPSPNLSGPAEEIFRPGVSGVGLPTCKYCPNPGYSSNARQNKIQGNIILMATITAEGRAVDIVVTRSPDTGLAFKAIEAVKNWKFVPATKDGKPVKVRVTIEMFFH